MIPKLFPHSKLKYWLLCISPTEPEVSHPMAISFRTPWLSQSYHVTINITKFGPGLLFTMNSPGAIYLFLFFINLLFFLPVHFSVFSVIIQCFLLSRKNIPSLKTRACFLNQLVSGITKESMTWEGKHLGFVPIILLEVVLMVRLKVKVMVRSFRDNISI